MAEIQKGVISSVKGGKATVVLGNARNAVTTELVIPWDLYKALAVNDSVAFVQFDDGTGLILARMDGKRSLVIENSLTLENGKLIADDVKTSGVVSLNAHKHSGVESGGAETTKPTG